MLKDLEALPPKLGCQQCIDAVRVGSKNGCYRGQHIILLISAMTVAEVGVNVKPLPLWQKPAVLVVPAAVAASLEDIRRLRQQSSSGIEELHRRKAIYAGPIDLREALRVAKEV